MSRNPVYLAKKSIEAYREDGLSHLLRKTGRYIQTELLFTPWFPPLHLGINNRKVIIGGRNKGYMTDNVRPREDETVLAIGAYDGKDAAMFGKVADRVYALEPSPRNYSKSKENLKRFSNIKLINKGAWKAEDCLEINYGKKAGDDGFLKPDSGSEKNKVEEIPVNTIENIIKEQNIEIDFLKVEAEGSEPEIIEGLGEIQPYKIVVNIDKERNGETPGQEIVESLKKKGYTPYEVKRGAYMFFRCDGKHDNTAFSETLN